MLAAGASHLYPNIEPAKADGIVTDLPATHAAFDRRTELARVDVVVSGHDLLVHQRHAVFARSSGLFTVLRPPGASCR